MLRFRQQIMDIFSVGIVASWTQNNKDITVAQYARMMEDVNSQSNGLTEDIY